MKRFLLLMALAVIGLLGFGAVAATAATPQTISFTSTPPSNATVGGAAYTVTATATSGLAVELSIDASTASVCGRSGSTSGSDVTFKTVGTCTIDANQVGNSEYEPAPQAQQSFTVAKGTQSIGFTSTPPSNATVDGLPYTVAATGGASGEPVVFTVDPASGSACSVSGSTVSFLAWGTCTIDANQAGNANYEVAPKAEEKFTVKNGQSISFTSTAPASATVGTSPYTVAATASSGLPVIFSVDFLSSSVCSISGSTVSFIGVGTCTIDADQPGNIEYWQAVEVPQEFTVIRAPEGNGQTNEPANGPTFTFPVPISELFAGQTASQEQKAAPPVGVVRVISMKPNKRSGGEIVVVTVSRAGLLSAKEASSASTKHPKRKGSPALIKPVSVRVGQGGKATLQISPTKAGASELKRKHRLSVKVLIAFTPTGGTPGTTVKTLVLSNKAGK